MNQTQWLPGLLVLALGVVAGIVILFTVLRKKKQGPSVALDEELLGHERRLETLLEQIRELQADRHTLGDERYEAERTKLERLAAETMRARDARAATPSVFSPASATSKVPVASTKKPGFSQRNPQVMGAIWGAGVVGFFVALGFFLSRESKPRADDESMTGMKPPNASAPAKTTEDDGRLVELLNKVKAQPDDIGLLSEASHELIRAQRFEEAERLVEHGVGLDPFHPELRIHRSVLRATRGELLQARHELNRLADVYPSAHEALVFSGAIAMQTGDAAAALAAFERFVMEAPRDEQPPQLQQAIVMLRQQLGAGRKSP
jgi:tetratricopeptide (TPR) repeat protein